MRFSFVIFFLMFVQTIFSQNNTADIVNRGLESLKTDNHDEMNKCFDEALANNKEDAWMLILSSSVEYISNKDFAKAELLLNFLISRYPDRYMSYFGLGTVKNDQADYETAIKYFLTSIEKGGKLPEIYDELAYSNLMLDKFDDVIIYCDLAIKQDANYHKAHYVKAYVLNEQRKYREAFREAKMAKALCSDCNDYKDLIDQILLEMKIAAGNENK